MIEIFKDVAGHWRFRVKAGNGQIVASSEGYSTKSNAKRGYRALLEAVCPDVLSELRAGTLIESEAPNA